MSWLNGTPAGLTVTTLLAGMVLSLMMGCTTPRATPRAGANPPAAANQWPPSLTVSSPPAAAQPTASPPAAALVEQPSGAAPAQEAKAVAQVSPQAMQALDRMGAYLRSLNAFEVEAFTATDEVVEPGLKVQLDGSARMQVRRPDRLRLTVSSDRKQREMLFDGKSFTLVAPRVNYYATTLAPPTLKALFESLDAYDIEMPLADLFLWGTERMPTDQIKLAVAVGPATIDGVPTEHYLFGQDDVSWQIWIQEGERPLPRKLVITTLTEPQQPQHVALMRWNTSPALDDKRFVYKPPKDAIRIPLRPPEAARGSKPREAP